METHPSITLRQLELFCAAAERGSFAAAAQALFLTPNAIALAVRELETTLGVHLCVRRRARGLVLTPAGGALLERARILLRDARDLELSIGDEGARLEGPVSLGCYSTLAATVLPPLMDGLKQRHPGIDLRIVDGTNTALLPLLRAGQLDAMISYAFGLPPDLERALLYRTEVHVLLPVDHPLAAKPAVALSDLADLPLILLDLPPSGDHTLDVLLRAGVRPRVSHRTSNFELVRSLVARGFGYSLLIQKPNIDVSYEGRRLAAKRISPTLSSESAVIAWPHGIRSTERARAVLEFARESVAAQQWTPSKNA